MRTTVPATLPIFNDQDMAASLVERRILKLVSAWTLCEGRRVGRKEAAYGSEIACRCPQIRLGQTLRLVRSGRPRGHYTQIHLQRFQPGLRLHDPRRAGGG